MNSLDTCAFLPDIVPLYRLFNAPLSVEFPLSLFHNFFTILSVTVGAVRGGQGVQEKRLNADLINMPAKRKARSSYNKLSRTAYLSSRRNKPQMRAFSGEEKELIVDAVDKLISNGDSLLEASRKISAQFHLKEHQAYVFYKTWKGLVQDRKALRKSLGGKEINAFEFNIFCKKCTFEKIASWQGWPLRDKVPYIPVCQTNFCPDCGGTERIESSKIGWVNIHGAYSTGLPDYWRLKILNEGDKHWGFPYIKYQTCTRCRGPLMGSIHVNEFVRSCPNCKTTKQITLLD
ncbi:MAG: hypothetical protein EBQ92_02995 [Proteobacteria bacterium]|nr:hypothetical protein [Pseudomonadota bacterium]